MHPRALALVAFSLLSTTVLPAASKLTVSLPSKGEILISVDPSLHQEFGLSYPVTYRIRIPAGSANLKAFRKHQAAAAWSRFTEKTTADFFNGEEVVRFDYAAGTAFVSAAFDSTSNDLFFRLEDSGGQPVAVEFQNMCRYYDNRQAAVTVTADDWTDASDLYFNRAITILRSYNIPVTAAIVTGSCTRGTWQSIQRQLDIGGVEAASHSRTHQYPTYGTSEVAGSKQDILANLRLPTQFRNGPQGYVYVWVQPYGATDNSIENLVSQSRYLVERSTAAPIFDFSAWDPGQRRYQPAGVSLEMGIMYGGISDLSRLNSRFDNAMASGGIYHMMMHPSILSPTDEWSKPYVTGHLSYISNRRNVWYANFGTLYVYHLLQDEQSGLTAGVTPVVNAVTDGSFEAANSSAWQFYSNGVATLTRGSSGTDGSKSAEIIVTAEGTNVQLYQAGISLEPNTSYQLSFDAYCNSAHDVEVSLGKHVSPYTNYGLFNRKFDLSNSWQNYTVTFTTTGFSATVSDGRLLFWFAPYDAAGDNYFIDNIILGRVGNPTPTSVAPQITQQPTNLTVTAGQTATFSVSATGTAPLSYQWQRNGTAISGAASASYTTPAAVSTDSGAAFRCVVSNGAGSLTSQAAILNVNKTTANLLANGTFENGTSSWTFYTSGAGSYSTVSPGSSGAGNAMMISISTEGTNVQLYQAGIALQANTSYQLSFDAYSNTGHNMELSLGQHGSPYTNYGLANRAFDLTTAWQTFSVTFTTTGFSGSVSDGRLVLWLASYDAAGDKFYFDNMQLTKTNDLNSAAPTITTQPVAQSVTIGQTATFSLVASGSTPLAYQWQKNSTNIVGATSASYTTPATAAADNGATFRCVVSNSAGSLTSQAAVLTVSSAAPSILTNGTFESGTTGWTFYTSGAGSYVVSAPGSSGSGSAAQIAITTEGTNVQLYQAGLTLAASTSYKLSFDAYCNTAHDVEVSLGQHGTPYTNYGLANRAFDLTTAWQSYSVTFTTSGFSGTVSDGRLLFWLAPYDAANDKYYLDNIVLAKTSVAKEAPGEELLPPPIASTKPTDFTLVGNFPNPFNPTTVIRYGLPEPAMVSVTVYSVLGQEVARLIDGYQQAGTYDMVWDGRPTGGSNGTASSGVYLCRMVATSSSGHTFVATTRMVLMK
jgi:hypothetical protein